jgi:hypothetical protein
LEKFTAEKKIIFFVDLKLQFPYPYASVEEALSSQKRTSSTQNIKFLNFFLLLWFIFALLDPDPDSEHGSGSTDQIESGSETPV